ncbi:MAG TPA: Fic/DOC family N-terminal domain-containing protein [bacterium]|nr:Fic/DOC family N-terminal domain-containing protein [bacterium]
MNLEKTPSGRYFKLHEEVFAFIPEPLPPKIDYDKEMINLLVEANGALGELRGLARMTPDPNLFVRPFMNREAVLSSKIEGTETEIEELLAYQGGQLRLPVQPGEPAQRDLREVVNYVAAMNYGLKRHTEFPISLRLIRELHKRLMYRVRGSQAAPGEFRRNQNFIGKLGSTIEEARYIPPLITEMHESLDGLEKYIHGSSDDDRLIRLALIHYQFEAIHPFSDGNGRVGRLLISLLTVFWELLPLPLLYLSAYLERNRDEYNKSLNRISTEGDWSGWLKFFLRGVREQALDATQRFHQLLDLQSRWHRNVENLGSNKPMVLVDMLFKQPIISIPLVQRLVGYRTYQGAQYCVHGLVERGILHEVAETKQPKLYVALDIVRVTNKPLA